MVDCVDVPVLSQLLLDKVLLVGTMYADTRRQPQPHTHLRSDQTAIGRPLLTAAKVLVEVQEHSRTEKVRILNKKKRSRSSRKPLSAHPLPHPQQKTRKPT